MTDNRLFRSYRYLIYDKLGFGMDAYGVLMEGLDINNALLTEQDDTPETTSS